MLQCESLQQQEGLSGTNSKYTAVPMLIIMKEHMIRCNSAAHLYVLGRISNFYGWDTYDEMTVSYFSFLLIIWLLLLSFFYFNWHNNCLWHKSDVATSFISSALVVWTVENKEAVRGSHDNVLKMEMRPGLCRGKQFSPINFASWNMWLHPTRDILQGEKVAVTERRLVNMQSSEDMF